MSFGLYLDPAPPRALCLSAFSQAGRQVSELPDWGGGLTLRTFASLPPFRFPPASSSFVLLSFLVYVIVVHSHRRPHWAARAKTAVCICVLVCLSRRLCFAANKSFSVIIAHGLPACTGLGGSPSSNGLRKEVRQRALATPVARDPRIQMS
jgi:hypothetical protein